MTFLYGQKWLQTLFRKIYFFSLKGMNYNIVGSGEEFVIQKIIKDYSGNDIVIFDVGANVGQYLDILVPHLPANARVFSFEPSPIAFEKLKGRNDFENILKINAGLGEKKGFIKLFGVENQSTLASSFQRENFSEKSKFLEVPIDTIDEYCHNNGIEKIDFLKVDVEGMDLAVLKGAKKMIDDDKISSIQFEFGGTQVMARVFIKDFWDLLHSEYTLYRILKNNLLEIKEYSEMLEIFAYANYLAVKKK
jgi:FkbM family methyltransferase